MKNYTENQSIKTNQRYNDILDLRYSLANRNMSNIWGGGFVFESDNDELVKEFNKFNKRNNLLNVFSHIEKELSLNGRAIVSFQKLNNGEIMLAPTIPYFFNGVAKIFNTPTLAIVYVKHLIGTNTYIVKSTYTLNEVVNEVMTQNEDGEISMYDKVEIYKELGIPKKWVHNFGFVPLFEITNLPFIQYFWNNFDFKTLADWWPAKQFENVFYDILVNLKKELYYNHARVFIENADQKLINQFKNTIQSQSEFTLPSDFGEDVVFETDNASKVNFQTGNSDYQKYVSALESVLDLYFKFANSSRMGEGGGAQKTAAETNQTRANLLEFLKMKINHRENVYSDMINKYFYAIGKSSDLYEYEFTFRIVGNIARDDTSFIDNLIKQVQVGSISIIEMISQVSNIPLQEAIKKYEIIKEFNDENDIMTSLSIGGGANVEFANGGDDGGAPTKDKMEEIDND